MCKSFKKSEKMVFCIDFLRFLVYIYISKAITGFLKNPDEVKS